MFLCRPSFLAPSAAAIVVMSFLSAPVANAQGTSRDSARVAIDTVEIVGRIDDLRGVALSASEGRVGARDLRLRPITREGELLETVPRMIVTQHSGDGKANQYFVRGFNLDHVATAVSNGLRDQLGEEVRRAEQQVGAKVDALVDEMVAEARRQADVVKRDDETRVAAERARLDEQRKAIEARLRELIRLPVIDADT